MSQVILFEAITTESALLAIEEEAKKWVGFYGDMEDKEQRKFIKDKSSEITDIIKKVERARIDLSKDYKNKVEKEAVAIKARLEAANKPFTELLDEWKAQRAVILKAKKDKEDAAQKEIDHGDAIMENKVRDFERKEAQQAEAARLEQIRIDAIKQANIDAVERERQLKKDNEQALQLAENKRLFDLEQAETKAAKEKQDAIDLAAKLERDRIHAEKKAAQDLIDAENKRLADIERAKQQEQAKQKAEQQRLADEKAQREANQAHVIAICKAAKESLMAQCGISEDDAIKVVKATRAGLIQNVVINF